jgi:hypothetical protein
VTISCAGPQLALTFAKRLQLRHVWNTVAIENPTWGQLGCSGFIILDKNANILVEKTIPFLEFRESAFQYVEDVLDAIKMPETTEKSAAHFKGDSVMESYLPAGSSSESSRKCGSASGG